MATETNPDQKEAHNCAVHVPRKTRLARVPRATAAFTLHLAFSCTQEYSTVQYDSVQYDTVQDRTV